LVPLFSLSFDVPIPQKGSITYPAAKPPFISGRNTPNLPALPSNKKANSFEGNWQQAEQLTLDYRDIRK